MKDVDKQYSETMANTQDDHFSGEELLKGIDAVQSGGSKPRAKLNLSQAEREQRRKNIERFQDLTDEERHAKAVRAGQASVAARKKKKEFRELARAFLEQPANPKLRKMMEEFGCDPDNMTNAAAMITRLFTKVITMGDLPAARTLIEWAGMAPLQHEKENAEIARLAQVASLMSSESEQKEDNDAGEDVVFYIPDNGRNVEIESEEYEDITEDSAKRKANSENTALVGADQ